MNTDNKAFEAELDEMSERIATISRDRPSHKEVLAFLKDVVTEQFKIKAEIEIHPASMDEDLLRKKSAEGFPLLDRGDLELDTASATNLFKGLCKVLKQNVKVRKEVEEIEEVVSRGEVNLEELFKKTAEHGAEHVAALSEKLNVKAEILFFLAENSLRPIFEAYADALQEHVDQESWWRSYCPVCGSKPVMAELVGQERKRFLICSSCGYEWRFKRIQCPFCENEERRKFKYFFAENEERAHRVETCQKCKKYIKTVDTEELDEAFFPAVEDMGTLHLDVLAKQEGYEREVHPLGLNLEDL
jgi:FdhE protein